jgi:hypothetical protein
MAFWRERNGQPRPPAIKVSRQCASSMTEPHGWLFIGSEERNAIYTWNPAKPTGVDPV